MNEGYEEVAVVAIGQASFEKSERWVVEEAFVDDAVEYECGGHACL